MSDFVVEGACEKPLFVFGCVFSWLAAVRLDLEDAAVYVSVGTGCVAPFTADGRLPFCFPVRILLVANTLLVRCIVD